MLNRIIILVFALIACFSAPAYALEGTLYYPGQGYYTPKLEKEAQGERKKAFEAQASLGSCYDRGSGVEKNQKKAFNLFSQSAINGDLIGKYNLALYFYNGTSTPRNLDKARDLCEEICRKNPKEPLRTYTNQLLAEIYGPRGYADDKYADNFYKALMNSMTEYATAENYSDLGVCYCLGIGVHRNRALAESYLKRALKKDPTSIESLVNLAKFYERDRDFSDYDSEELAYDLWVEAADRGSAEAQVRVSELYCQDLIPGGVSKARLYLLKAAEQGNLDGMEKLSSLYEMQGNYSDAFKWANSFYEKGKPSAHRACYNLARFYYYGIGTNQSHEKAYRLYEEGANSESELAKYCKYALSKMLFNGEGCVADNHAAFMYLNEASQDGCGDAQYEFGRRLLKGEGIEKDPQSAVEFLKKAYLGKDFSIENAYDICYQLSVCYRNGIGVNKDVHLSDLYFREGVGYLQEYGNVKFNHFDNSPDNRNLVFQTFHGLEQNKKNEVTAAIENLDVLAKTLPRRLLSHDKFSVSKLWAQDSRIYIEVSVANLILSKNKFEFMEKYEEYIPLIKSNNNDIMRTLKRCQDFWETLKTAEGDILITYVDQNNQPLAHGLEVPQQYE